MSSYSLIIAFCIIIILSFFFNIIAKKTNIPSVLMLLITGIGIKYIMDSYDIDVELSQPLELLGITGLILIVLEAALDLEITRDKLPIIVKSFLVALISLILNVSILATILSFAIQNLDTLTALIYATPLAIISSAIVIPSVASLAKNKREFMIYESTFSDILGIMVFYFLIGSGDMQGTSEVLINIVKNLTLTIGVSSVASLLLLYMFQKLNTIDNARYALFFALLILLYAIGKVFHLSSLIIILIFGLILRNHKRIIVGKATKYINSEAIDSMFDIFKMMTEETAFVVRTLFFVVFGMSITIAGIFDLRVITITLIFIAFAFISRYFILKGIAKEHVKPETFIAPRGLISILLFYSIPKDFIIHEIESGILFLTIFISASIMGVTLIREKSKNKNIDAAPSDIESEKIDL